MIPKAGWRDRTLTTGAVLAGGLSGAALGALPWPGLTVLAGALAGVAAGAAMAGLWAVRQLRRRIEAQAEERAAMTAMITALSDQIAGQDRKIAELDKRSVENPALVWRAASADIETLSALVSDLARTVARHDEQLTAAPAEMPIAAEPEGAAVPAGSSSPVAPPPEPDFMPAIPANDEEESPGARPPALSAAERAEWRAMLVDALASDRLELCLQPIVTLPQRKPVGYEASLRLRGDGDEIKSEADLRRIAAAAGAADEIDRTLVRRAAQVLRVLRARGRAVTLTCTADIGSLLRPAFHGELAEALGGDGHLARGLLLEIEHADLGRLGPIEREMLNGVCDVGVGLSVGGWRDLRIRVDQLRALGIRQVRVPAQRLMAAVEDRNLSDIHIADLATMLERGEIALVATGVESEPTVPDLLDLNVPLAAGMLFGAMRPVRPEILEPRAVGPAQTGTQKRAPSLPQPTAAPPTAPSPSPAQPPPAAPAPRQSFRSLLRRA